MKGILNHALFVQIVAFVVIVAFVGMLRLLRSLRKYIHPNSQLNQTDNHMYQNEIFIIFVRTLQFMKLQMKEIDENEGVHIPLKEIEQRFFPYPKYNCKNELQRLQDSGLLMVTEKVNPKTDRRMYFYQVLQSGAMDLKLLKPKHVEHDSNSKKMMEYLRHVSLAEHAPEPPAYFKAFLRFRDKHIGLFFKIDDFAGRVHTPVTSLSSIIRPYLKLYDNPTVGIDVATMQPLLLGSILKQKIGSNEYSEWIDSGEDIYAMLQLKAGLPTREQAKKQFFEILFAPANNKLTELFGNADWITWVNEFKKQVEPLNPHNIMKPYSNVAWLLQTTEVTVMRKVWANLIGADIPFLSVHDEVVVQARHEQNAVSVFYDVFDQEFQFFKLNIKELKQADTQNLPHCEQRGNTDTHDFFHEDKTEPKQIIELNDPSIN